MTNQDRIIKKYNAGQDDWLLVCINKKDINSLIDDWQVRIEAIGINAMYDIKEVHTVYFYEWLFNPKYKVFEVFKSVLNFFETKTFEIKQPEQIIEYLAEV